MTDTIKSKVTKPASKKLIIKDIPVVKKVAKPVVKKGVVVIKRPRKGSTNKELVSSMKAAVGNVFKN